MPDPADEKPQPTGKGTPRPGLRSPKALIGKTISDRYRIERLLGEGGMGAVYQAEHVLMRKRMAIKVLHPEMTRVHEVVERFKREATAAAHIEHPHVVNATDFGQLDDGSFFLALEYVEGKSLREVIGQGKVELGRALHIARQIASALGRAHSLRIVHRDLKPENVMLVERDGDPDFVKVLDFGIAKVQIGELTAGDVNAAASPGQPVLTQAGMVYGTPEYMAPEQALGQSVDARADLYALGIIMYEMLTGFRPFEAESKVALLGMQVTAPVPPMAQKAPDANVPPEVEGLIGRLLAKLSEERLGDAKELIGAISDLLVALATAGRVDVKYAPGPTSSMLSNPQIISGISPAPPDLPTAIPKAGDTAANKAALPKTKLDELLKGKGWLVALGGGLVGLLVLVTTVAIAVGGRTDPKNDRDADTTMQSDASTVAPASTDQRVAAAIAEIDKGNFGAGIKQLEEMGKDVEGREDVHRALFKAYAQTDRPKEAMREAGLVFRTASALDLTGKDKPIRIEIRNTAVLEGQPSANKAAIDEAFALMQKDMGPIGWDDLYDIAYGQAGISYEKAADRAKREIMRGDRKKMSAELAVTVELHAAAAGNNCPGIKSMLDRAVERGDERTLVLMKNLTQPKWVGGGGGIRGNKQRDVLGCIHGSDKPLDKAIAELEGRLKKK
jgi:eukaryotic-like serine/threonine-protein kinase